MHECVWGVLVCVCVCKLGWLGVLCGNYKYVCDFGEHLASLFPIMYPMSRPEGDSITLKYSGHTAR